MRHAAVGFILLASCSTQDPMLRVRDRSMVPIGRVLEQPVERRVLAALMPAPQVRGLIRRVRTPTSCVSRDGVNPYVWFSGGEPRAGGLIEVDWVSRACEPFEDEPMALLVSFDKVPPVDLSAFGHRECWLTVGIGGPRDYIVTPGPGSILSVNKPGRMSLRWSPGPEWIGVTVYAQAVVATPYGHNGWLCSPGLEITVGSP